MPIYDIKQIKKLLELDNLEYITAINNKNYERAEQLRTEMAFKRCILENQKES
jgi:hypothetical protein